MEKRRQGRNQDEGGWVVPFIVITPTDFDDTECRVKSIEEIVDRKLMPSFDGKRIGYTSSQTRRKYV